MLLQRQSVLVGIPKIHLSVRSLSSFFRETDFFVRALNPALFLLSFSFCSLANGTFPLKMLSAHSQTVDETAIGFGDEVFTNTRSRLL